MACWMFKSLLLRKKNDSKKPLESTRLFALKESRWFTRDEYNLFRNVFDSGYILELRIANKNNDHGVNKDTTATLEYGIVLWMEKHVGGKKQAVVIHLINGSDKTKNIARGIRYSTLESFWFEGTEIRINNMDDHKEMFDSSSQIHERINRAYKGSYKWNDSRSFVHWCRYGNPVPVEESSKKKQIHDAAIHWGSISASAGALLYLSKQQRRRPNVYQRS